MGPARSARFFDENLVRMYKSIFVFANADRKVLDPLLESDLLDYLVVERTDNCPPVCRNRYEEGYNNLFTNTQALSQYVSEERKLENDRQDLSGMHFDLIPPTGGIPGTSLTTIYSTSSFNRWTTTRGPTDICGPRKSRTWMTGPKPSHRSLTG